jgi:formylglycine-generating enzyme required for sulfatase activity
MRTYIDGTSCYLQLDVMMVKEFSGLYAFWIHFAAAAMLWSGIVHAKEAATTSTGLGIVTEQPADGRFVKIDGGFMVPYTEKIPGTDVTFEMIPIPGGEFLMGSPEHEAERADDEGPQVRVKVEPYWMARYEVTWDQYKLFMAMYDAFKKLQLFASNGAGGADNENLRAVRVHAWNGDVEAEWDVDAVTAPTPLYDSTFTYSAGEEPNQPAVTMTPFAAKQFTKWLSGVTGNDYRLPSEAEWEYAARAGATSSYSFGDDGSEIEDYAWIEDNSDFATHPVGTKKPNAWGLHDMHGNVGELTLDEYAPDTYAKLAPGPVDAENAIRWPTKIFPRVIRGGSWYQAAPAARSAARHKTEEQEWKFSDPNIPRSPWWYTEEAAMAVGMRVMRPLIPLTDEAKNRVWEADHDDLRQDVRDRLREGRGAMGKTGKTLPQAVKAAQDLEKASTR